MVKVCWCAVCLRRKCWVGVMMTLYADTATCVLVLLCRSTQTGASPEEGVSSTKVTPTCITSAKTSHTDATQGTPRTYTSILNSVRGKTPRTHMSNSVKNETPRTHTSSLNSVKNETPRTHTSSLNSVKNETPRTHTSSLNSVRSDAPPRTSFSHTEELLRETTKGNHNHFARSQFARGDPSRQNSLSRHELPGEELSLAMFQPLRTLPLVGTGGWRWWQGYNDVVWRPRPRPFVASLQCRATVRLGGGMDEWCTANCNANYCPPAMCVCQRKPDAFSPRYELVEPSSWTSPYKQAVRHTTYRHLAPLQLYIPDSRRDSPAPSKSMFSPPSTYNAYQSEEVVRTPFVDAYSPFAQQPQHQPQPQPQSRGTGEKSYGLRGVSGWNRKSMVCRATGHYTGLPHYDNWCTNNCAQAMCPLLMCTCDTF